MCVINNLAVGPPDESQRSGQESECSDSLSGDGNFFSITGKEDDCRY